MINKEKILKAGKIASQIRAYAKEIVKKGTPLLEIAEKLESKIVELGGKSAFPLNLSINEIAAHYTPSHNDQTLAHGLLKIDIGVHVDGWIADTAFSIDLENREENKKLIQASREALENAIKIAKINVNVNELGKVIQEKIESFGFIPIINLYGHGISHYVVHSGITVPNIDNKQKIPLEPGQYAIEPFATPGNGKVNDGPDSGIYLLVNEKNVRSPIAREILSFIKDEYKTMPFCSRWLVKKFGTRALLGLRQLEDNGNLHNYAQLIESSKKNVSQAEHSILIEKDKIIVTTE